MIYDLSFLGSERTLAAVSLVILVYLFHKFIIGVHK